MEMPVGGKQLAHLQEKRFRTEWLPQQFPRQVRWECHGGVSLASGNEEEGYVGAAGAEGPGELEPGHQRHVDVGHHHLHHGADLLGDLEGVPAVLGLDHGEAGFLQHTGQDLPNRSEEHTSELQSHSDLVCRLLLEKKKKKKKNKFIQQKKKKQKTKIHT